MLDSDETKKAPEAKVYLRHVASLQTFDFKIEINGVFVSIVPGREDLTELTGLTEDQLGHIRAGMMVSPKGHEMVELLDWLIEESKKDQEGRYVSASSAEVVRGQATLSQPSP